MNPTATVVSVKKLPDVVNKIYIVPREILNEYGKVKEIVYEEWIFTADKIGGYKMDKMSNYEIQYNLKTKISDTIKMLIDKINTVKGVYASIYLSGDDNVTINIYPWDIEDGEE